MKQLLLKNGSAFFIFIQQKTLTSTGGEMNAVLIPFQWVSKHLLNEDKASGGCHGIGKEFFVQAQSRFRTQLCRGIIDLI